MVTPGWPALTLVLLFAFLQPARPAPRGGDSLSGLIVGQVVDADGGRPLAGAVAALGGPPGARVPHPRVLTGPDGYFVFRGLRRGSYTITAVKGGFADGAHGRTRPAGPSVPVLLADGQRLGVIIVRLWKHASIGGTVVDESGERLIGVRVQAYRRAAVAGHRRYVPSRTATTDDRGLYRIGGLIPGDYVVGTVSRHLSIPLSTAARVGPVGSAVRASEEMEMSRQGAAVMQVGDSGYALGGGTPTPPPPVQGRLSIYPAMFHPAAPAGDAATVITVRAGEEHLTADLQLTPAPTVRLSGYVVGPDGPVTMTPVRLVAAHTAEIPLEADSIATMTDREGNFTFPAVPSGHYILRLFRGMPSPGEQAPQLNTVVWAEMQVNVGTEDVDRLSVEAAAGVRIGGRIDFVGAGSTARPALAGIEVSIESADDLPGTSRGRAIARVDRFGEFRSPPLPGGRYYVRIENSPAGWMFKSATSNGSDVADTPLTLSTDSLDVVVTFTDRWSGLRGSVQNRQGLDDGAAVIVLPTDRETWASSGLNPRRVRLVRTGRTGEYSLNLPSGEYYVTAVPDAQASDWQDPAFLEAASRSGTRVVIPEGERKTQDLRTRELR
jgi:hypothetical protein